MQNIGMTDRIIRVILTVVFVILALTHSPWWFIPALLALVTGIVGWCGLYSLVNISTCEVPKAKSKKTSKKRKK